MENSFQVAKFVFQVRKTSSLFCLVENGPEVIWVACIGLILYDIRLLGHRPKFDYLNDWPQRAFLVILKVCNTKDTQSQRAAHMKLQNKLWNMDIYAKKKPAWPSRPPHFHDPHILTDLNR